MLLSDNFSRTLYLSCQLTSPLQPSSLTGLSLFLPLVLSLSFFLPLSRLSSGLALSSGGAPDRDLCDPSGRYIFHYYDTSRVNGLCDIPSTGRISRCSEKLLMRGISRRDPAAQNGAKLASERASERARKTRPSDGFDIEMKIAVR